MFRFQYYRSVPLIVASKNVDKMDKIIDPSVLINCKLCLFLHMIWPLDTVESELIIISNHYAVIIRGDGFKAEVSLPFDGKSKGGREMTKLQKLKTQIIITYRVYLDNLKSSRGSTLHQITHVLSTHTHTEVHPLF
jgi:hypothetical protein